MDPDGAADSESFEALFQTLQDSVQKLERGGLTLEASLAEFERGMQLADRCDRILVEAELRVTRLSREGDDDLVAEEDELGAGFVETA